MIETPPPFPIYSLCQKCQGKRMLDDPAKPDRDAIYICDACWGNGFIKNPKPSIVVLCGSTRFSDAFQTANLEETLAGKIVLSIGCNLKSDEELFARYGTYELQRVKARLDELHLHKIDLSDEVYVLNVDGYVGLSTAREIAYAHHRRKPIRFLHDGFDAESAARVQAERE